MSNQDGNDCMSALVKGIIRCIFNECIDQLNILRDINGRNARPFSADVVKYVDIDTRYMGVEHHADRPTTASVTNYNKVANDINMLMNMLREGADEIVSEGTCVSLQTAIEAVRRMFDDEKQLLESTNTNKKNIKVLRNKCERESLANVRTLEETNAKIQKLRFEVEDVLVHGKCETVYYKNWERARREQNAMMCDYKENVHRSVIKETKDKIDIENRCHVELQKYVEECTNDCLDGIQNWMKQYDKEIETREGEMINLKNDLQKLTDDHVALQQTYEARKVEIEDWLEYKRIKKEKDDRRALEVWAATKIQAWWRGVMFRKKLGPYRKKKKGKDKNKKGAKKNK